MSRRNQLNQRVTSWEAAEQIFADIDSEDNFEDHNDNVSFPSADYMSQDTQDSDWEYDLDGVADLTLDDRPMDISPVSDEQQGGNEAGNVRPMSTLLGSNSDEDKDTGQTLPNSKTRRLQLQRANHSCNESTDNESANKSDSPHCSDISTPLQVARGQGIYRRSSRVQNSRIAWDIDEVDSYLPKQIPFVGETVRTYAYCRHRRSEKLLHENILQKSKNNKFFNFRNKMSWAIFFTNLMIFAVVVVPMVFVLFVMYHFVNFQRITWLS